MQSTELELAGKATIEKPPPSSLSILDAAVRGGINKDNIEVVERLVALRREELKEEAQASFARAFFQLRKNMPEFYADKVAKNDNGQVVFTYCSESEISDRLEPELFKHGFTMLFGQRQEEGRAVAVITLMHEGGHQETREYSVRAGATNRMKDATAADAGSTTTAWRHLIIKMFGLKSRIRESDDARLLGDKITQEQADSLRARVKATKSNEEFFLKFAGATSFETIPSSKLALLNDQLARKEKR